jgi:hypothetical protein
MSTKPLWWWRTAGPARAPLTVDLTSPEEKAARATRAKAVEAVVAEAEAAIASLRQLEGMETVERQRAQPRRRWDDKC